MPLAFEDYAFGGFLSEGFLNFLLNLFSGLLNLLVVCGCVWTFIVCYVAQNNLLVPLSFAVSLKWHLATGFRSLLFYN